MSKTQPIKLFALTMLITGAIDSIRNLPAMALFGTQLPFFLLVSSVLFLIPVALVAAELSSAWPQSGGIYDWVKKACGEEIAFLAIWLQWINTMVWYPTILSFIGGTLAYLISPSLAHNKYYMVVVIISVFWSLTFINLKGISTSTKFASICTVLGMLIPMALIIGLALFWLGSGKPAHITSQLHAYLPHIGSGQQWLSLTAIMTAFLGLELATVHVRDVNEPQRTFPRALLLSVIMIFVTILLGAMAIAVVLPHNQINLVDGVMQVIKSLFAAYHVLWLMPLLALMILVGSLGEMINWIISPAKGLYLAAKNNFLPPLFTKKNDNNVASVILITQAILVTLLCAVFLLMPSVNGSYWLLTDLSTQLYMLMYLLMFVSMVILRFKYPTQARPFKVKGGTPGLLLVTGAGILGCIITLVVGFLPPQGINVGSHFHYEVMFSGGLLLMLLPVILFYAYKKLQQKSLSSTYA